jgi:hypothetical protein
VTDRLNPLGSADDRCCPVSALRFIILIKHLIGKGKHGGLPLQRAYASSARVFADNGFDGADAAGNELRAAQTIFFAF